MGVEPIKASVVGTMGVYLTKVKSKETIVKETIAKETKVESKVPRPINPRVWGTVHTPPRPRRHKSID